MAPGRHALRETGERAPRGGATALAFEDSEPISELVRASQEALAAKLSHGKVTYRPEEFVRLSFRVVCRLSDPRGTTPGPVPSDTES